MNIQEIHCRLLAYYEELGVPTMPQTSVISPLYPGQFCYCLDERHWFEQYGDIVNVDSDHFQKIQPAIRLADFDNFFAGNESSSQHLGCFSIATINGAHIVLNEEENGFYQQFIEGVIHFLTNVMGLEKDRISISYFVGGLTGSDIEETRKTSGQMRKVMAQEIIPKDALSLRTLKSMGFGSDQLISGSTWTNFLAINWYACIAPWGYRNEIFYRLDDGSLLDIATIEHLTYEPIVQTLSDGEKIITGMKPWSRHLIIDGFGLERMVTATSGHTDVMKAMGWGNLLQRFSRTEIEAVRILHRVFTDSCWSELSKGRKKKIRHIMGSCLGRLSLDQIKTILRMNADIYQSLFPDLYDGISRTVDEIFAYRQRRGIS